MHVVFNESIDLDNCESFNDSGSIEEPVTVDNGWKTRTGSFGRGEYGGSGSSQFKGGFFDH
jgi:hypothetical protein